MNDFESQTYTQDEQMTNTKTVAIARKTVRFILSYIESQTPIISRTRLSNAIRDISKQENSNRVTFASVLVEVNRIFKDVYGYSIRGLTAKTPPSHPPAEDSTAQPPSMFIEENNFSKCQHLAVVNVLQPIENLTSYKLSLASSLYNETNAIAQTANNQYDTATELAFKGILTVVLAIIIFSKNNILQPELLTHMAKFGIPTNGEPIPIIELPVSEFLKQLERKQYVLRIEEKSDMQGDVVTYQVGKRTKTEFDLDSLTRMVREILSLPEEQIPELKDTILKSIGDTYSII